MASFRSGVLPALNMFIAASSSELRQKQRRDVSGSCGVRLSPRDPSLHRRPLLSGRPRPLPSRVTRSRFTVDDPARLAGGHGRSSAAGGMAGLRPGLGWVLTIHHAALLAPQTSASTRPDPAAKHVIRRGLVCVTLSRSAARFAKPDLLSGAPRVPTAMTHSLAVLVPTRCACGAWHV